MDTLEAVNLNMRAPYFYPTLGAAGGSSQQGCNLAGESPVVSVARVGHVAIPHLGAGNQPSYAWCKRPGCPVRVNRAAVGATGGSSKCGSLNVKEWLQPREEQAVEVALQPVLLCMPNLLPLR